MDVRKTTNRLIELAEDRVISWEDLARTALNWLSEDDVTHMARVNEFLPDEDEDDIDEFYHDYSEDELRRMGCFDNLNEDDYTFMSESEDI